jgi:hypothetical protein
MSSPSRPSRHEEDGSRTPIREQSGRQTPRSGTRTPARRTENGTATPARQGTSARKTPGPRDVCDLLVLCLQMYILTSYCSCSGYSFLLLRTAVFTTILTITTEACYSLCTVPIYSIVITKRNSITGIITMEHSIKKQFYAINIIYRVSDWKCCLRR